MRVNGKEPAPAKCSEYAQFHGPATSVSSQEFMDHPDRQDRHAIVAHLRFALKQGDKSLVGNKGYRKYLKTPASSRRFEIDDEKIQAQEKYDGVWVLQTDPDRPAQEIALRYKELWPVEQIFRTIKSILDNLQEVTVEAAGEPFVIRTQTRGGAGQAFQAAGVALGPAVRAVSEDKP